jgi:acetolactate synthase-1/2/3 large subunit
MPRMTGARALVKSIMAHGVDTIFGLPGVQMDPFFNALHDERNGIRVVHSRHEQGAAYMAFGYAQSTGKVGAYAVVPGPGLLNSTAALATAYGCNTPVLCVAGQIPSAMIGRDLGMLHEIPDQLAILRGLTKWAARIDHPTEAADKAAEAFRQLRSGRPRPVALEMAMDVMAAEAEIALPEAGPAPAPLAPDPEAIAAAAKLLGGAKKPMIFVGGGIFGAQAELLELAEALRAPVVSWRSGKGAMSDAHDLSLSQLAAHRLWPETDVVLAVGTRIRQWAAWGADDALKVIRIDIDPTEMNRPLKPAVAVVADARLALAALIPALAKHNTVRPSRRDELAAVKAGAARDYATLQPQMAYLEAIRAELPEDGFFVEELTQIGYVARLAFPVYRPRTFVTTGYQGTLGFGFASALGVKVANPDKIVLSVSGDGGFMYNVQELATAVRHGIGVVAVVFNDNAFGNVRRMQRDLYGGRVIASDLHNPDFVKLAELFGATGLRAASPAELRQALRRAFKQPGPVLIEVPMPEAADPWKLTMLPKVRPARA